MSVAYTKQELACYLEGSPCLFTAVIKNSRAVDALLFMATFKHEISEDICASFILHERRPSSSGLCLGFISLCEDLLFILMGNIIQLPGRDAGLRATCWAHYAILWPLLGFCWSYKESRSWRNKKCSPLPPLSPGLAVPSSPSLSPASNLQLGRTGCIRLSLIERSGDQVWIQYGSL